MADITYTLSATIPLERVHVHLVGSVWGVISLIVPSGGLRLKCHGCDVRRIVGSIAGVTNQPYQQNASQERQR